MRWWRRKGREQDLERELRSDLEMEAAEQREKGLSAEEARYAARRAFGNTTLVKEEVREMWGRSSLERLGQDIQYALRLLRKTPTVTSILIGTLALGLGMNTAVFSVVNAVMIHGLPYKEPDRLVSLWEEVTSCDGVGTASLGPRNLFQSTGSATLIEGFDSASYGRGVHWCFVPDHKHGSGIGDHWHGGKDACPSTPLGRFNKPFVTGPNRIPIFRSGEKGCQTKQA